MDLTVGKKLFAAIGVVLFLVILTVMAGIAGINSVTGSGDVILMETRHLDAVQELRIAFGKVLMPANDYLIHGDVSERDNFEVLISDVKARFAEVFGMMNEAKHVLDLRGEEKKILGSVEKDISEVEAISRRILRLAVPVGDPEGAGMMEKMDSIADKGVAHLDILLDHFKRDAERARDMSEKTRSRTMAITVFIGSLIIAGMIAGGLSFARGITVPLRQLVGATRKISSGDMTARAEVSTGDEIGELAGSFNNMTADIARLIDTEKDLTVKAIEAAASEKNKALELKNAYERLAKTQEDLVQAEKLSAVGNMTSSIVHELKNPLGVIQQGVEYISIKVQSKAKNVIEVIKSVKRNIARADRVVRDLLDFARIQEVDMAPADVNSVLEESLTLVEQSDVSKDIEIKKELSPGLSEILIDAKKMEQVFINLFSNAFQAMPAGGRLTLRSFVKKVSAGDIKKYSKYAICSIEPEEETIAVEIEDTGGGIPEEDLEKVFNPFFTTKKSGEGTGLGLAVVKNIIQLHKGCIYAQSEKGKGTKFVIILRRGLK